MSVVRFGEAVRAARVAKGLSMHALADVLQCSQAYLNDIELGRRRPFPKDRVDLYERLTASLGGDTTKWRALADAERAMLVLQDGDVDIPSHVQELVFEILSHAHEIKKGQIMVARDHLGFVPKA